MSLKTGEPGSRKPWSLSARLAVWFALSSITFIFFILVFVHQIVVAHLNDEHDRFLRNKFQLIHDIIRWHTPERTFPSIRDPRIFSRLLKDSGFVEFETTGMTDVLPSSLFTSPSESPESTIQIAVDHSEELLLLRQFRERLVLVLLASIVVCATGALYIVRRGLHPLVEMASATEQIDAKNLDSRIPIENLPVELRSLAESMNMMLARIEASFSALSQFSADIAHELRTPINNLHGEIEIAIHKKRTESEYEAILSSTLEETTRVSRLIDSLLFLARTNNAIESLHLQPVQVDEKIRKITDFYGAAIEDAGIILNFESKFGDVTSVDKILFERAIANLLSNAITHTPRGGMITVASAKRSGALRVEVTDTGCGISAEHLPHIFDRFYRVDSALLNRSGMGLGLSIVKKIAELHCGSASISSRPGKGTTVSLEFALDLAERLDRSLT